MVEGGIGGNLKEGIPGVSLVGKVLGGVTITGNGRIEGSMSYFCSPLINKEVGRDSTGVGEKGKRRLQVEQNTLYI